MKTGLSILVGLCGVLSASVALADPGMYGRRGSSAAAPSFDLENLYSIDLPNGATDRMELADTAALEPTNGTISFFLRVDQDGQNNSDIFLSKWREATDRGMVIDQEALQDGFTRPRLVLCATNLCAASYSLVGPRGSIGTNTWTSIGVTVNFNTATARLYIDGAENGLSSSGTFPAAWVDTAADWTIGARDDGNDAREMDGQVDDVMIFPNVELSAHCMFELHNKRGSRTIPSSCAAQPATWCRGGDDNNGTGTTCSDRSGNNRNWTLSGAAFTAATAPTRIPFIPASTLNRSRQVYIVMSQSNGSGRGLIGGLTGTEFPFAARVYNYGNAGPEPAGAEFGTVRPATEPIDSITGQAAIFPTSVEGAQAGVGPVLAMANRLAELWPEHRIGVIPCALGGTEARDWATSRGQPGRLWGECSQRWAATAIGGFAEPAGILVYQAESDAQDAIEANQWAFRWAAIIEGVRDSIGRRYLPVVFVRLPPTQPAGSFPSWAAVRENQANICNYLDHCTLVDAPDGPYLAAGDVHLATPAQLELGPRLGDAFAATDYGQLITAAGAPSQFVSLGCGGAAPPCTIGSQCNNRAVAPSRTYDIIPGSATVDNIPANLVIVSCGCFTTGETCVTSDGTAIRTADGNDSHYVFLDSRSLTNTDCQATPAHFAWTREATELDYYRNVVADVQENFCTTETIWRLGTSNGAMEASFTTEATADEYPTTMAIGLSYGGPVDGGVAGARHPSIATGAPANARLQANRQDNLVNAGETRDQCANQRGLNEGSPTPIPCVQTDGGAGGDGSIVTACGANMISDAGYATCTAVPGTGVCCTATPDGGRVTQYCECNSGGHSLFSGEYDDVLEFLETFFRWGTE